MPSSARSSVKAGVSMNASVGLLTLVTGIVLAGGLSSVPPASGSASPMGALAAPHALDTLGGLFGATHPQRVASMPDRQEPPPPVSGEPVQRVEGGTVVSTA